MKRWLAVSASIAVVSGLWSCDKSTVNNYVTDPTGVAGNISPVDVGTVLCILGADTATRTIDNEGFFVASDLRAGSYTILVKPVQYTQRRISNVLVVPGEITQLKTIPVTTLPYPLYGTWPADGAANVYRGYPRVAIYSDEPLDTVTLKSGAVWEPPITGSWSSRNDREYEFIGNSPLGAGTSYKLTLSTSVKTAVGEPLERELVLNFSTEPLRASISLPPKGIDGGIQIGYFMPRVSFNDSVSMDSAMKAIHFDPAIEGEWICDNPSARSSTDLHFFPTGAPPQPETYYHLIISNDVNLVRNVHLPITVDSVFRTEPYGVSYSYPRNGYQVSTGTSIQLAFNTLMDTNSVVSSFTVIDADSNTVELVHQWQESRYLVMYPSSGKWDIGGLYTMRLTVEAKALSGVHLTKEFVSVFSVY